MTTVSDGTNPPTNSDTDTVAIDLAEAFAPVPGVVGSPYGDLPAYHAEHVLPSEPVGKARPGTPSKSGRVVLPIGLALVSVVALGAGWAHLESDRAEEAAARAEASKVATKPPVPALDAPASPAASTAPSASGPAASAKPSASGPAASAKPTGVAPVAPAPSDSASDSVTEPNTSVNPATTKVDRSVPVVVYNATSRTGLAAKVAKSLRADGWTVVSVGNWRRGGVATTTIFVAGEKDAAATMLDDLPAADAVRAPISGMPQNRLVVVIGKDYPRS